MHGGARQFCGMVAALVLLGCRMIACRVTKYFIMFTLMKVFGQSSSFSFCVCFVQMLFFM